VQPGMREGGFCVKLESGRALLARRKSLASLRPLALNLWKREQTKKCAFKAKQLNVGWYHASLVHFFGVAI
jgi:hypothetical protein